MVTIKYKVVLLILVALSACNDSVLEDSKFKEIIVNDDSMSLSDLGSSVARASRKAHHFPSVDEIMTTPEVEIAMNDAWFKMLSLVVPYKHRNEIGFYIYYDEGTGYIWPGAIVLGEKTSYTSLEPPSINLGAPIYNLKVCATFHCHTPYYGTSSRRAGCSEKDEEIAYKTNLPGIVYDYPDDMILTDRYPYDDRPPFPYTCGPKQRPDIYY